ncbi:hypothetical protein BGZ46_004713 [Entomortierella lignicola]|nr:hypothetical protein BGZ46_004713 [Entomortierella lignicola]
MTDSAQEHSHDERSLLWPDMATTTVDDTTQNLLDIRVQSSMSLLQDFSHTPVYDDYTTSDITEIASDEESLQSHEQCIPQVPVQTELVVGESSGDLSVIELEIFEQNLPDMPTGDEAGHKVIPYQPRRFIFKRNSQLLLGRAPSCGSDAKARMRQHLDEGHLREQAQSLNGHDDGLFTNQVVSKIHAALYELDGQLILEDKESTHGTFVNDERVQSCVLKHLDRIRLGRDVVRKDVPYVPLELIVSIKNVMSVDSTKDDENLIEDPYYVPDDEEPQSDEVTTILHDSEPTIKDETEQYAIVPQEADIYQDYLMDELLIKNMPVDVNSAEIDVSTVTDYEYNDPVSNANPNKRKRSLSEHSVHEGPETKRTALVAAAIAGAVIGSIGTIFTLASM